MFLLKHKVEMEQIIKDMEKKITNLQDTKSQEQINLSTFCKSNNKLSNILRNRPHLQ